MNLYHYFFPLLEEGSEIAESVHGGIIDVGGVPNPPPVYPGNPVANTNL
jgi:hypothetical protein